MEFVDKLLESALLDPAKTISTFFYSEPQKYIEQYCLQNYLLHLGMKGGELIISTLRIHLCLLFQIENSSTLE